MLFCAPTERCTEGCYTNFVSREFAAFRYDSPLFLRELVRVFDEDLERALFAFGVRRSIEGLLRTVLPHEGVLVFLALEEDKGITTSFDQV